MFTRKSRKIADLRSQLNEMREQRDEARSEAATARRNLGRATRLYDTADRGAQHALLRLARALRACIRYRAELARLTRNHAAQAAEWREERRRLIDAVNAGRRPAASPGDVARLREALARTAAQRDALQAQNDILSREAVDRAGTLAPLRPTEAGGAR
jgi:chromosome segregation ATPase